MHAATVVHPLLRSVFLHCRMSSAVTWERKYRDARACRLYTRVDGHMICSHKDCQPRSGEASCRRGSPWLAHLAVGDGDVEAPGKISGCCSVPIHVGAYFDEYFDRAGLCRADIIFLPSSRPPPLLAASLHFPPILSPRQTRSH